MYYTIYKTTNQINGKFYIGAHKTKNLNDKYMGSGKILTYAINKYGIENFNKEVLYIFDNSAEMFAKEAEIVTTEFLAEENTYNLKIGGMGGWDYINKNDETYLTAARISAGKENLKLGTSAHVALLNSNTDYAARHSTAISSSLKSYYKENQSVWVGKRHTDDAKNKMSQSKKGKNTGSKNSMYNKRWIKNLTTRECSCIHKDDLEYWLTNGWVAGKLQKDVTYIKLQK